MEYQNIPFKNDRMRLVLYKYMKGKAPKEYKMLSCRYSDNDKYESVILDELYSSEYICIEGVDRYNEVEGKIYTTELGRNSLNSGRFPSEAKAARYEKAVKILTLMFSAIASIGGVKYLIELVKYIIMTYGTNNMQQQ